MDTRTTQLLRALDPTSAELLVALLEEPRSEKILLEEFGSVPQATGHRKLQRLADAGLIRRNSHETSRGAPWIPTAPQPTTKFLSALFSLVDALEAVDQRDRNAIRDRLALSKPEEAELRLVEGSS